MMAKLLSMDESLGLVWAKRSRASTGMVIQDSSAEPVSKSGQGSDARSSNGDQHAEVSGPLAQPDTGAMGTTSISDIDEPPALAKVPKRRKTQGYPAPSQATVPIDQAPISPREHSEDSWPSDRSPRGKPAPRK